MVKFLEKLPPAARPYVSQLLQQYDFTLRLTRNRTSKLGDYRYQRHSGRHTITLNRDQNPYRLLLTFIHELAHLVVSEEQPRRVRPHGTEWQATFRRLMQPLLVPQVFPEPLLAELIRHMRSPRAAAGSDPALWQALAVYDIHDEKQSLQQLPEGERFVFRQRLYEKIKLRRTRVLCREVATGRLYLIPGIIKVEAVGG